MLFLFDGDYFAQGDGCYEPEGSFYVIKESVVIHWDYSVLVSGLVARRKTNEMFGG